MKTAKLVIGIISFVLCLLIMLQSCAAGLGNALADNGEVGGSAGMLVAFLMLAAGVVGVSTRTSKGGGMTAGGLYVLAGLIGISNYGSYADLKIWSILCFIFAIVFFVGGKNMDKPY